MASRIDEGTLRRELDSAGVGSLWDEVRLIRRGEEVLALGGVRVHDYGGEGSWTFEGGGRVRQDAGVRPAYLELDSPEASGWTDYELDGRLRFSSPEDWVGPMVHCRLSDREDRLYLVLRRSTRPWLGLSAHGTAYTTGRVGTWRRLDEGVWHRFRVRVETDATQVRLAARSWPDGEPEPAAWDLEYADASETRIPSGAPGLYAEGPGVKEFADLRVSFPDGSGAGTAGSLGWREPPGSDILVDLLSRVPAGAPLVLMSHTPDIFLDARELSIPLVVAGHTQGGQIRLPLLGALVTDTRLPRRYASGLFHEGGSTLFVNRGIGTSRIPLRFLSPPEAAVITLTREDAP